MTASLEPPSSLFDALPPELISSILQDLARADLARVSLVSHVLRTLSTPFLYSSVRIRVTTIVNSVASLLDEQPFLGVHVKHNRELLRALTDAGGEDKRRYIKTLELFDYNWMVDEWLDLEEVVKGAQGLREVVMDRMASDFSGELEERGEDAFIDSFWNALQESKSLRSLRLLIGPSIELGLDQFHQLERLYIKSYSIDQEEDGSLPLTLTHLAFDYVHHFDETFFRADLFGSLQELVLRNEPDDVLRAVIRAIKSFTSGSPPMTSPLEHFILDPFPTGFACLVPRNFTPHLQPLFQALHSPSFTRLTRLSLFSTPVTINFVADARDFLHDLTNWLPQLERLVFFVGTGVQFVPPDTSSTALVLRTSNAPPPSAPTDFEVTGGFIPIEGPPGVMPWIDEFARFSNLTHLTHNLIEVPHIIDTRDLYFSKLSKLKILTLRACPRNGFRFERTKDAQTGEEWFKPGRPDRLAWVDE